MKSLEIHSNQTPVSFYPAANHIREEENELELAICLVFSLERRKLEESDQEKQLGEISRKQRTRSIVLFELRLQTRRLDSTKLFKRKIQLQSICAVASSPIHRNIGFELLSIWVGLCPVVLKQSALFVISNRARRIIPKN